MVAAASAVVLTGAGLLGISLCAHQIRFVPLEQPHSTMAASLQDATPQTPGNLFVADASRRCGYQLQPTIGGCRLVSGRQDSVLVGPCGGVNRSHATG